MTANERAIKSAERRRRPSLSEVADTYDYDAFYPQKTFCQCRENGEENAKAEKEYAADMARLDGGRESK